MHQAYARGATPVCPALDQFEMEMKKRLIPLPLPASAAVPQTAALRTAEGPTGALRVAEVG